MKGLRFTKFVKEINLKGVRGKLGAKNCFQGQSAKFCFAIINKIFILAIGLGTRLLFYKGLTLS